MADPRSVRPNERPREPDTEEPETPDDPEVPADPDDETIFAGWRTIQVWEIALFLATFIAALLIWNVFIFVHGGFAAWRSPFS